MKGVNKAVIVISKICEVLMWVSCVFLAGMTVVTAAGYIEWLNSFSSIDGSTEQLDANGFYMQVVGYDGELVPAAYILFFITMFLVLLLMAKVFRNVYLIFKTANGETKFSKGATPFQPDNIRMVREIGIFILAMPIVELVMSMVVGIVCSGNAVDTVVDVGNIFVGLVVLALSQYFAYGMELQNDVDGLV